MYFPLPTWLKVIDTSCNSRYNVSVVTSCCESGK